MNELEERLQEDLAAAADAADLDTPALADVMRTVHRAEGRRRLRYAAAVAAVALPLAAVAVTQLVAITDDSSPRTDTTTTAPEPPSTTRPEKPATSPRETNTSTTVTAEAPTSGLVLAPDGLGIVQFGDPVGEVVGVLTAQFGEPIEDTTGPYSGCLPDEKCPPGCGPDTIERQVTWPGRLTTRFYGDNGELTFAAWVVTGDVSPLATAAGVRLSDSLDRVRAVYGSNVSITWTDAVPPRGTNFIRIRLPGGDLRAFAATEERMDSLSAVSGCEQGDI